MQVSASPRPVPMRIVRAIVVAALLPVSAFACAADRSLDYRCEVEDQPVAVSAHSQFNVRISKSSIHQPADNATITGSLLNMPLNGGNTLLQTGKPRDTCSR